MNSLANRLYQFFIFLCIGVVFSACSAEFKLANHAASFLNKAPVLLVFPEYLLIENSKPFNYPDSLSPDDAFSARIDSSFFLHLFNDSVAFSQFKFNTIEVFKNYGFSVFTEDQMDEFLKIQSPKLIFDYSQLQVEEAWRLHKAEETMPDEITYYEEFLLNSLALNAWISVSFVSDSVIERALIFSETLISDKIDGLFLMNNLSGKVFYEYQYYPLKSEDGAQLVDKAAQKVSLDILDFFINNYLEKNLISNYGKYPERFWRYLPNNKHASPSNQKSGYIILEDKIF